MSAKRLSATLRLLAINTVVLLALVALAETCAYIGRTVVMRMPSRGWVVGHPDESEPCLAMVTHPILSHASAHDGRCKIRGGHALGQFVYYADTAANQRAVVTLGGSTTSGFYQHYADGYTYPYWLNELTSAVGVKVINGGLGGYSSTQELLKLVTEVPRLKDHIEIVISLNGINDRPDYHGPDAERSVDYPFMTAVQNRMFVDQVWVDQRVYAYELLPNLMSFARFLRQPPGQPRMKPSIQLSDHVASPFREIHASQRWLHNVQSMRAVSATLHAEYLVFIQPTMALTGVQSRLPEESTEDYKLLTETLERDSYVAELNTFYGEIRDLCSGLSYCFDISDQAPPTGNNYSDPQHHNANGNRIIADAVFARIAPLLSRPQSTP